MAGNHGNHNRYGGLRVVALGGGTGLPVLLRGLKAVTDRITAIVTVTDDGGSSGRLRGELGILPPGDIRNCLVALADTEPLMETLFQHRFSRGSLAGHSFGNLFIGAMTEILGDFQAAVRAASQVLKVRGQVLPSTLESVGLCAELADGTRVCGETAVAGSGRRIRRVTLEPGDCRPVPEAVAALAEADLVVLGPGSLYTSVIPNVLVAGLAEAIRRSPARRVYVVNVMTQPGETDGYTAADHLQALWDHGGPGFVDAVLVNSGPIDEARLAAYREQGAEPVPVDRERLAGMGVSVVEADLVTRHGLVRHDPALLAAVLVQETSRENLFQC